MSEKEENIFLPVYGKYTYLSNELSVVHRSGISQFIELLMKICLDTRVNYVHRYAAAAGPVVRWINV